MIVSPNDIQTVAIGIYVNMPYANLNVAYVSPASRTQQTSVVNTSSTCHFNNREISAIRAIGPLKCGVC